MKPTQDSDAPSEAAARETAATKTIRAELIIATLALVTSACASIAAIVQTREATVQTRATIAQAETVAKQLGASVWPYLTIDDDFTANQVGISITNQGLGPALIRSATLSADGRPLARLRDLSLVIDSGNRRPNLDANDLGRGSVIRPAESVRIFSLSDRRLTVARSQSAIDRTRIDICYCSLLHDCWSLSSSETEPKSVHDCGASGRSLKF